MEASDKLTWTQVLLHQQVLPLLHEEMCNGKEMERKKSGDG